MLMEEVLHLDNHEKASLRLTELQVRLTLIGLAASIAMPVLSTCMAPPPKGRLQGVEKTAAFPLEASFGKSEPKALSVGVKSPKSSVRRSRQTPPTYRAKGHWRAGEPFEPDP
jgi:hypothetical protein